MPNTWESSLTISFFQRTNQSLRSSSGTVFRDIVQTKTRASPKNLATAIPCPDPPPPYIWYNNLGGHLSSFLTKLKTLQNKALRVISGAHYRDNALPLYKEYKVLQLHNLYAYETAKFVYCCLQKEVPSPFLNYFTKVCETTQRTARQSID